MATMTFATMAIDIVVENPPPDPGPVDPPPLGEFPEAGSFSATFVEDFEITFTFGASANAGRFLVHGHWMDNSAGANVTAISPASVEEIRDTVGGAPTTMAWWNGASRGMSTPAQIAASPDNFAARQGFTGWWGQLANGNPNNYHVEYHDPFNIDPGRTGNPITGFGPVCKQTQTDPVASGVRTTASARESARWLAGLWMLNGGPPTAAPDHYFMPPVQSETPRWFIGRNGSGSTLDMSLFPALDIPATNRPDFTDLLNRSRQFAVAAHFNTGSGRNMASALQGPGFYGREYSIHTSDALILLCSNWLTTDQKVRLAEGIVQQGIMMAGLVSTGAIQGAAGMGNTSSGRKLTLVLAALLTGDSWLHDQLMAANASGLQFAEDIQMTFLTADDLATWSAWGGIQSYAGQLGRGEWRGNTSRPVPSWLTAEVPSQPYRHNWAAAQFGQWAAMRLVPPIKAAWGGATAYDDYFTRYIPIEESRGWVGQNSTESLAGAGVFYRDYYLLHRSAIDAG